MEPQTVIQPQGQAQPVGSSQPYTANDGTQLNPTAVSLAKAIRTVESNGNYNAVGDSGQSHGAYQFNKDNFANWAKQYGLDSTDFSPVNQDKVAYNRINDMLKQGDAPSEVAARWNGANYVSGKYQAINPGYVDKVKNAYQQHVSGQPPIVPANSPTPDNHDKNFLENLVSGNLLGAGKQAMDFLFPIIGDVGGDINGTNKKNLLEQGADLGLSALPFIPGLGEAGEAAEGVSAAAKSGVIPGLLKTAGIGAGAGALGAISQGGGVSDTLKGAALGGATGGVLGGAGALFSKIADVLPQRIARSFLPRINEETAQYAVQKGLGAPEKMLAESEASLKNLGGQLGDTIQQKMKTGYGQFKGYTTTINDLLPRIEKQFPNAGLDAESLGQKLMQVAPNQKTLIDKLVSGEGLNLEELHTLNHDVGANTYKAVFDNPATKAGKAIASSFYHSASDIIKETVPKSAPFFDQLSKEYPLNRAIKNLIRNGQKGKAITFKDIISVLGGLTAGGPVGSGVALGVEKAATSPTVNLGTAGLINKLGNGLTQGLINRGTAVAGGLIGRTQ